MNYERYKKGLEGKAFFMKFMEADCDHIAIENPIPSSVYELPKYEYPDEVVTAAMVQRWTHYGIDWRLEKDACVQVSALDNQKVKGKAIFGSGFLLSERAAAERAAAERAAAQKWELSEREKQIIKWIEERKKDK